MWYNLKFGNIASFQISSKLVITDKQIIRLCVAWVTNSVLTEYQLPCLGRRKLKGRELIFMNYYINAAQNLFQDFLQYIYTQHALSNVL